MRVSEAREPSRKVECHARQSSHSEQSGGALRAAVPIYQGGTRSIVLRRKGHGGRGRKPAGNEAAEEKAWSVTWCIMRLRL